MPVQKPLTPTDDLVASIFDGILEDRPWRTFLYHLRTRTDSELASLSLRTGGKGVKPILILDRRYEISKESARRKAEEYAKLFDADPLSSILTKPGEFLNLRDVIDDATLNENEFYRVLMQPANVKHYAAMCFAEPNGWRCLIRLMNRPDKPDYDTKDEELLRSLLPYLEKALTMFAELRRLRSELREFRDSLDRLTMGILILDAAGRLVDANEVARRIFESNMSISILGQKIILNNPKRHAQFDNLLKQALAWAEQDFDSPFVESLRIETTDGGKLDLLIRTVQQLDRYVGNTSPAVIVYISDSLEHLRVHENLLEKLFGLTATEARLASLLANGRTLSEAAEILGVTDNTVRGYSKAIFSKMGVNRQADLVRIILKSVAMFA